MSEEKDDNIVKIDIPLFTNLELEEFDFKLDNYLDTIVQEVSKAVIHDKENILSQKVIQKLQKENEENIEALEEWINAERVSPHCIHKDKIKAKIKELKQGRKVKINDLDGKQKENTFIEIDKIEVLEELLEE